MSLAINPEVERVHARQTTELETLNYYAGELL
jgi:hypothetical protein